MFTEDQSGEKKTIDAVVTSATTEPTYEADGSTVYTATVTFQNKEYKDTKTVIIPKKVDPNANTNPPHNGGGGGN